MLEPLGLSAAEESTYRYLIDRSSANAPAIADAVGLSVEDVGRALGGLRTRGIVTASTAGPGHYVAAPPGVVLGEILVERQQDFRRAEIAVQDLMDRYRQSAQGRFVTDVVDIVTGAESVIARLGQMQRQARSEVTALVRTGVVALTAQANVEEDAALLRGVRYRVVVEQSVITGNPNFYDQAREAAALGEEIRVQDTLPLRMLMVDRELALIPLSKEGPGDLTNVGALLVHPGALLDALIALYELLWERSAPIITTGPEVMDSTDRKVLELLLTGLTDRAVGTQLGMSMRTVQRRVRELMDQAGVSTRIQLGVEAARRGWLPRT